VSVKLTPAQRRVLEAAAKHPYGRVVGTSTPEMLIGRGLIEPDGFNGLRSLFKITNAGRQAVAPAPSTKASKKGP
jgi:hypothetical protein